MICDYVVPQTVWQDYTWSCCAGCGTTTEHPGELWHTERADWGKPLGQTKAYCMKCWATR